LVAQHVNFDAIEMLRGSMDATSIFLSLFLCILWLYLRSFGSYSLLTSLCFNTCQTLAAATIIVVIIIIITISFTVTGINYTT
jgi:hypothetical protein